MPGVGSTPTEKQSAPADRAPETRAASRSGPEPEVGGGDGGGRFGHPPRRGARGPAGRARGLGGEGRGAKKDFWAPPEARGAPHPLDPHEPPQNRRLPLVPGNRPAPEESDP